MLWEFVTVAKEQGAPIEAIVLSQELGGKPRQNFLFISNEWFSYNGGISTFNAQLAKALASRHNVGCYLPTVSQTEIEDANEHGVVLFAPTDSTSHVSVDANMLIEAEVVLKEFRPNVIVGHDRQTGGLALAFKSKNIFPEAKTCVIVHTSPVAIERHKTDRKSQKKIDYEMKVRTEKLAQIVDDADIALAVGSRLALKSKAHLRVKRDSIFAIRPGVEVCDKPPSTGKDRFILLFGRAEDARVKGIELAHEVIRHLKADTSDRQCYEVSVRGIPVSESESEFLNEYPGFDRASHYTTDKQELDREISTSSLVLMPSLEEGFGLVAFEAISMNRPVLISSNSGAALFLRDHCRDDAAHFIVDMETGNRSQEEARILILQRWVEAIRRIYDNWATTQEKLETIRSVLKTKATWEGASVEFEAACLH